MRNSLTQRSLRIHSIHTFSCFLSRAPVDASAPAFVRYVSLMDPHDDNGREKPEALALLSSQRPRNVNWFQAAALLFGDWGTSRLHVLGLAFLVAGRSSFWLIAGMSLLILAVGWAYG